MSAPDAYYITTPIYYVNDQPHIGHAYTTIACDVLARFMRLDGRRVLFLTGTDEHGQKVEKSALAAGKDPQTFCDEVSATFRELTGTLNCSNDQFIRTTEPRHIASAQALWTRLAEAGHIYLDSYAGWYAVRDEAFYAEDELQDGPPGPPGPDGKPGKPTKLAPTGAPVEWMEEPSYFFRLSAFAEPLLALLAERRDMILPPSRYNEVVSFVKGGLRDLSVSRTSFQWGVPVPGDEDHIMYVWLDALTNYITAIGYPETEGGKDGAGGAGAAAGADDFATFWPANVHMVGKDILRFHAVYWPAFLLAAGIDVPQRIFAHGWWTHEGQKISKSLGNVIDPVELVSTFGVDPVRYFLMREVPFGKDGDYSRKALIGRLNTDLANDLGNLCQRVLSMIHKNCDAQVPSPGALTDEDEALLAQARALHGVMAELMGREAITASLDALFDVVAEANRYVDGQAPWKLKKTDTERMATVLWVLAEVVRHLAILVQPVMPESAGRMLDLLAVPPDRRAFDALGAGGGAGGADALVPGTSLPKPEGIFPRWVEEEATQA